MDGVGDYTRLLAASLTVGGVHCALLSMADHHVRKPTNGDFGDVSGAIPYLRLPARDTWPVRLRRAMSYCQDFGPDWVSWQIVLYGFDPRGLSIGLGRRLREVSGHYKTHIMFHEIWIGEPDQSPLRHKIVGKVQKRIIRDLIKKLRPRVVHTHTPLYQYLLGRIGCRAKILPLFGNIPLAYRFRSDWLKEKWPEGGLQARSSNRAKWWVFVLFGSIHPEWDAEDFRVRAMEAARRPGKKCLLISIGRPGGTGERVLRALRQHEGNTWVVLSLGPQSEEDISQCLLSADFGVSTVPPENIFKSGTAAAMTEHGLPIIVSRPSARYRHCPEEVLLEGMPNVVRHFDLAGIKRFEPQSLLATVAGQFLEDLVKS